VRQMAGGAMSRFRGKLSTSTITCLPLEQNVPLQRLVARVGLSAGGAVSRLMLVAFMSVRPLPP
jgi:hypothetical protein